MRALLTGVLRDDAEGRAHLYPSFRGVAACGKAIAAGSAVRYAGAASDHRRLAAILDETLERFEVDGVSSPGAAGSAQWTSSPLREVFRALSGRRPDPVELIDWQATRTSEHQGGSEAVTVSLRRAACCTAAEFREAGQRHHRCRWHREERFLAPYLPCRPRAEGQVGVRALAPTGKAADRLKDLHVDAMTIHRALALAGWYDWKLGVMRSSGETRIEANTIVIDEASMIDVELLATLFRAIELAPAAG